jgi:hypothetical protein
VAGEQAGGVTDLFGGRREGRSSPEGFSMVEGIGGGEETVASRSRGHWWGPSGWEGCTQWHGAWGGVKTVGGALERAVRSGSVQPERNSGGGAEEQPRAPARRLGGAPGVGAELGAVMGSSEGDRGGIAWWLNNGSTMAQQRQWAEEEKGSVRRGALLLNAA